MKKVRTSHSIDWRSKVVDLLIVIVGITIAFKMNTWNESLKSDKEAKNYLTSFSQENQSNEADLKSALEFVISNKKDIDTLKQMLLSGNHDENKIISLLPSMMAMADFAPSETTMENIKFSGEFDLIKDIVLRKLLIETYNSFDVAMKFEELLMDYTNDYVTPFFFSNVRFIDFSSIDFNFIENFRFENIVIGYEVLMNQQITGYQLSLEKVSRLNDYLTKGH